jgi:glycosyltransferase involved in cell wall biosynthesis
MAREKLSVVILTKNEEDRIRTCLESIKWVDEIVLVDGESTDRTIDIAKEYGAKIVSHKFGGDFGEERNIGIDNSSGDWILQLDADEVVTEGFRKRVEEILNGDYGPTAYKFIRKNTFLGKFMRYGGWYHYSPHFFKKGYARYKGRVHHHLIADGEIAKLEEEIEHNPFDNITELIGRQNRYTNLEAQEIFDLRGKIDEKEIRYNIKLKPVKLFWKFYVKKKGYKEGMHGFIFSVLFAWVHFLKWVKYWELVREK